MNFHPRRRRRDGRNFKTVLELPALASLDPLLSGHTEGVEEAKGAHLEEQRHLAQLRVGD